MNMQKKILIVDDDSGITESLSIMLEMQGYEVSTRQHGISLLEVNEDKPHLILLDIWMAGIDGRDVCKELKADDRTREIPVIFISASRDVRGSAEEAGADDFLEKPFEMNHLVGKVKDFVGS